MKKNRQLTAWAALGAAIILGVASAGCEYIVPPIEFGTPTPFILDEGWSGIVNGVSESGGAVHVDLSIVNKTNKWSAMDVSASRATVTKSDGGSQDCGTVFVGTSVFVNNAGWYLAPGFVMKGYTGGSASAPVTQPLYVECAGVSQSDAKTLSITYSYVTGPYNYYLPNRQVSKTMTVQLDKIVTDTAYPIAETIAGLPMSKVGDALVGINGCTVTLVDAKRTDEGLQFDWRSTNPTEYQAYVHIGTPPVIGSDGILYGFYQTPHLAIVPITKAGGEAVWTTTQVVPKDVTGLYLLLPLESQQQKYYIDYVMDITDL